MRKQIVKLAAAALIISTVLAVGAGARAHEVTSKGVTVAHPWARATPGGSTVGAAFMEIRTADGVADKLVSASSPIAGRVEVHTHIKDGDVVKMRRVETLELAPGASRVLKPGGEHVMLFDLKQPLIEGDLVKLTLVFETAGAIDVEGSVEPAGALGPHGMDHQPVESDENTSAGRKPGENGGDQGHGEHHH